MILEIITASQDQAAGERGGATQGGQTTLEQARTVVEPGRTVVEPGRTVVEPGRTVLEQEEIEEEHVQEQEDLASISQILHISIQMH